MLSLVRLARSPRALVTVPHTHIRHFASEVPTNLPALYPGPSKKKAKAKKVERALGVPPQPAPEDVPEPEPESQPRAQSQSQAHETSEDFVPIEEDPDHPDNRPIRPPHGIKIDRENHGLSGFFRKFQNAEGAWDWAIVEQKAEGGYSGRSWSAPELRRKSFKDLHTLWYVLLRERNLLASQKEELRRLCVPDIAGMTDIPWKVHQCKKSMARIKCVINERRLAYEGAVQRFQKDKTLGKIGAVAEQEAAKERMKRKKEVKPAVTPRPQSRRNVGRRHVRTRMKSISEVPRSIAPSIASTASAAP